ncbi:MAG: sugar phosphorylase [Chloroflexi bacterium]|nr:sugar phosphorylase [Chloroflexota bacterium]
MERNAIQFLLAQIYDEETSVPILPRLSAILDKYRPRISSSRSSKLTHADSILITYPDQIQEVGELPLQTLTEFCGRHLKGVVSGLHILPFYPWSSDDGFSVMDYRAVAPQYGAWNNIEQLGNHFRLMFDAVINHASTQSSWFRGFLRNDPAYRDYFIEVKGETDLSRVVRPRALPLLTTFRVGIGREKKIWTTFSADQVDLNYHNPQVLLEVIELLLFYVSRGAEFIRLDAIAYIWKESGTSCISLPQTHRIVQLLRAVLDEVAPHVKLITETNVPHAENISYFGNGANEAQLVYNFSLPPLVLHAFQTGNASALTRWASTLKLPSDKVAFFNFLASHDGIGLNPLRGILPEVEIEAMTERIKSRGGLVSYKVNPDGNQSPYELNVNYFDALSDPVDSIDQNIERFVTAHAILFSFAGLPGIYFHSLFGSRGWPEGVTQTGSNRSVNRQKLQFEKIELELADEKSLRSQVFYRLSRLLMVRAAHAAFDPYGKQRVLEFGSGVFAILREARDEQVLCFHNVTAELQSVNLHSADMRLSPSIEWSDLVTAQSFSGKDGFALKPYQTLWLSNGK